MSLVHHISLCLLLTAATVLAEDVCYDDVGCFTTDYPWTDLHRPLSNLPQPADKIGTEFLLYTRDSNETVITYNDTEFGNFSPERKTAIVIHGFSDSKEGWMTDIKNLLLEKYDYNVILVDWSAGASIPYLQATANTQLVGRQVALLVKALMASCGAMVADMHCMGHSLGAHTCGYAGNHLPGLGRITGMDPAQPYYEGTQLAVHLDPSDAVYVDNIHTDGRDTLFLGVGFKHANGHVDFFPNDGKNQPGCGDLDAEIKGLIWDLATLDLLAIGNEMGCSHGRSHDIFIESLRDHPSTPLVAFKCKDYSEYLSGDCQKMDAAVMGLVGMDSDQFNLSGSYYLQTTNDANALPFRYYELTIELDETQEDTMGNMVFVLKGNGASSERLPGWSEQVALSAGSQLTTTVHLATDLGDNLSSIHITYQDHHGVDSKALVTSRVTVRTVKGYLETSTQMMCGDGAPVENQGSVEMTPCS